VYVGDQAGCGQLPSPSGARSLKTIDRTALTIQRRSLALTKQVLLHCGLTKPLLINNGRTQCQQQLALKSGRAALRSA